LVILNPESREAEFQQVGFHFSRLAAAKMHINS
jgi:hypothetical protein